MSDLNDSPRRRTILGRLLIVGLGLLAGCRTMAIPCRDELAGLPAVTTPSAVATRAAARGDGDDRGRSPTVRAFQPMQISAKSGTVLHGVLYYEDPFEDSGSDDGRFAWTNEDFLYWLVGPFRFLANTVLVPISATLTRPWQVMASDGRYAASDARRRARFDAQLARPAQTEDQ
ncbi:MAG: hypothetical protein ACE5EX_11460 [Phycisphaerae bacterium]